MQTIGLLVDEGVVLRNELPADLGRIDGGSAVCHDEVLQRRRELSISFHFCLHFKLTVSAKGESAKGKRVDVATEAGGKVDEDL